MDAAGVGDNTSTKVGLRLLERQANNKIPHSLTCNKVLNIQNESVTPLTKLKKLSFHRSIRIAYQSIQNIRKQQLSERALVEVKPY